jgi:hypothetical protein
LGDKTILAHYNSARTCSTNAISDKSPEIPPLAGHSNLSM